MRINALGLDIDSSSIYTPNNIGCGGQIGRPEVSHEGDWLFSSLSSQTSDLKIYTCRFLARCPTLLG